MKQTTSQTKLISFKLFIVIIGLLFMGGFSFAQTEKSVQAEIQEEHDTKNLDKLLNDYGRDQEQVLKDAENIPTTETTSDLPEEESPKPKSKTKFFDSSIFKRSDDPNALKKIKYSQAMKIALEPLQKMSEKELIKLLYENTSGSSVRQYIDQYPKLAVFTVRLIKSKDALPGLARVLDDEDRVIRFIGVMISTILFGFFLKRFMRREGRSILKAVSLWFFRFMIISSLRLAIILYFFSDEITPTYKIAVKTFF